MSFLRKVEEFFEGFRELLFIHHSLLARLSQMPTLSDFQSKFAELTQLIDSKTSDAARALQVANDTIGSLQSQIDALKSAAQPAIASPAVDTSDLETAINAVQAEIDKLKANVASAGAATDAASQAGTAVAQAATSLPAATDSSSAPATAAAPSTDPAATSTDSTLTTGSTSGTASTDARAATAGTSGPEANGSNPAPSSEGSSVTAAAGASGQ